MNKFKILLGMLCITLLLGACANQDGNQAANEQEVTDNPIKEENLSDEAVEDEQEEQEDEATDQTQAVPKHQTGLALGETGTVISGTIQEHDRYAVTLNSIEQLTEVEGETNYNEIFLKATVTIENIDEDDLPIDAIFKPSVGDENVEDVEMFPEFKKEFYDEDGQTPLSGETIAPGEKVLVDYYFDTVEAETYRFAFGNPFDQIITYANWKINTEDM